MKTMIKLFEFFKRDVDELDPNTIERKARRLAIDHKDLLERYDERTEEVIDLLREKSQNLWTNQSYIDSAMQYKEEAKELKVEKAEKQQEVNVLKREWSELAEGMIQNSWCPKPQAIKTFDEFILLCQLMQFMLKDDIPTRGLIAAMKRLKIEKEYLETNYNDLYINLRMKDWQV